MNSNQDETKNYDYWHFVLPIVVVLVLGIILLFYQTAWSMASIWYRSETFAHGFLILPIVIWLIWEKRTKLASMTPEPELRALALLTLGGVLWLAGYLVTALVVKQLAMIIVLIAAIWTLLGNRIAKYLAFPLLYLFFAVPMGEDLVPPLMELTATVTVFLIKLSGVPVFREGLYFSLPTGNWSVVEACSGVRYLIASVTLGALYAYLTYQHLWKRLLFMLAATIVPIVANSLRAYIIVMLGHLSDMKIATGVDHLVYGWLFFGLVMLILFSVGSIWRDPAENKGDTTHSSSDFKQYFNKNRLLLSLVAVISVSAVWPVLAYAMGHQQTVVYDGYKLSLPDVVGEWNKGQEMPGSWRPIFPGSSDTTHQVYSRKGQTVMLSIGRYTAFRKGGELINSQNTLVNPDSESWRVTEQDKALIKLTENSLSVDAFVLKGDGQSYRIYSWYRIGSHYTSNPYMGKLLEAYYRLSFGRQDSARFVLTLPVQSEHENKAEPNLSLLSHLLPVIEEALDR